MDSTLLSDVHPGVYHYVIYVRVSRMWEFHGKNDDEQIKHLDLVLIDQKHSTIIAGDGHENTPSKPFESAKQKYQKDKLTNRIAKISAGVAIIQMYTQGCTIMSYIYVYQEHGSFTDKIMMNRSSIWILCLFNCQGTAMYGEVPPEAIPTLRPRLNEQGIYYMKKIIIDKAKPFFKPVLNLYMIKLNKRTEIIEVRDEPDNFPKYTFCLTPFQQLPMLERNTEYFIDVIGRINALSDPTTITTNIGIMRTKCVVQLIDLSGNMIEISLWGPRAEEFEGDQVYEIRQNHHVVAIFVGTTLKSYAGSTPFLSGTSACRWYINVGEITEIASFYASIPHQVYQIQKIDLRSSVQQHNMIEQKTLLQLKSVDPFEDLKKRFECTITITKLAEKQSWCYAACPRCNTSTRYDNGIYTCKKEETVCSHVVHRYKLCFIGTAESSELKFMLFDERAASLVGKTAENLIKQYTKIQIPPEISALITQKITAVVKVMPPKTGYNPDEDPIFEILNIKKRHGKDFITSAFANEQNQPLITSNISYSVNLPQLKPIEPKKQET